MLCVLYTSNYDRTAKERTRHELRIDRAVDMAPVPTHAGSRAQVCLITPRPVGYWPVHAGSRVHHINMRRCVCACACVRSQCQHCACMRTCEHADVWAAGVHAGGQARVRMRLSYPGRPHPVPFGPVPEQALSLYSFGRLSPSH